MPQPKYWDDMNQRSKAHRYAKRHDLDMKDENVKKTLREMYRTREGRTNPMYKAKKAREEQEQQKAKDRPNGRTIEGVINGFMENIDKDRIKKRVRVNTNEKPLPTGFVSDLPLSQWLVHYLPHLFGEGLYPVQLKMLEYFLRQTWLMIQIFRSAGKTWLAQGILAYKICQNPEERLFILGEEYKKTVQRVRMVRNLLGSPKIMEDYGYLVNEASGAGVRKGKSTEGMFECYRDSDTIEPTLMAITWKDSQSLGMHYTGGIMDDPWSGKLQTTSDALSKWMNWWGEFQGSLEHCRFLLILCTRKGVKDLYYRLKLEKQFAQLVVPLVKPGVMWDNATLLIDEENDLYTGAKWRYGKGVDYELTDDCRGKYSMTTLNRNPDKGPISYCVPVLRHNKPMMFEMEYQQNPYLPEGNVFKWKHVNLINQNSMDIIAKGFYKQFKEVQKIAIMDATLGESEESDLNCLYLLGTYRKKYFVIDAWVGHWNDEDRYNAVLNMERKYGGVPLYIESDYAQVHVYRDIKKRMGGLLKVREFKSKGKGQMYQSLYDGEKKAAKKGKIHSSLSVPWSSGEIYILDNLPGLEELQTEIITFPDCSYFDCIDTLAMGVIILRGMIKTAAPMRTNRRYQTSGLGRKSLM